MERKKKDKRGQENEREKQTEQESGVNREKGKRFNICRPVVPCLVLKYKTTVAHFFLFNDNDLKAIVKRKCKQRKYPVPSCINSLIYNSVSLGIRRQLDRNLYFVFL